MSFFKKYKKKFVAKLRQLRKYYRYKVYFPKVYSSYCTESVQENKVLFLEMRFTKLSNSFELIYKALEDVEAAMKGMLDPVFEEKVIGEAEVRQTFRVSSVGTIAGCFVLNGKVERNAGVRVIREDVVIHEGKLASLKRFKDDVKEVAKGFECGLQIENYNDIKEGDIIEVFVMEEIKRTKKSKVQQISQEHVMNNK